MNKPANAPLSPLDPITAGVSLFVLFGGPGTPEEFFSEQQHPRGIALDALNRALSRAESVLQLLLASGANINDGFPLSHESVMDALESVIGSIDQAKMIIRAGTAADDRQAMVERADAMIREAQDQE